MILIISGNTLYKNYSPFDSTFGHKTDGRQSTKEEMEALGMFVDYIPEPEEREGYYAELKVDNSVERMIISDYEEQAKRDLAYNREKCFYFEYVEIPKGQEDVYTKVSLMEQQNADIIKRMALKELQIKTLQEQVGTIIN